MQVLASLYLVGVGALVQALLDGLNERFGFGDFRLADFPLELDSFDLIINLIALGLGVSFVPHRALPLYAGRRKVRRINTTLRFSRELVVVTSRELPAREHVRRFVECILF